MPGAKALRRHPGAAIGRPAGSPWGTGSAARRQWRQCRRRAPRERKGREGGGWNGGGGCGGGGSGDPPARGSATTPTSAPCFSPLEVARAHARPWMKRECTDVRGRERRISLAGVLGRQDTSELSDLDRTGIVLGKDLGCSTAASMKTQLFLYVAYFGTPLVVRLYAFLPPRSQTPDAALPWRAAVPLVDATAAPTAADVDSATFARVGQTHNGTNVSFSFSSSSPLPLGHVLEMASASTRGVPPSGRP